jgi:hypothetical protein
MPTGIYSRLVIHLVASNPLESNTDSPPPPPLDYYSYNSYKKLSQALKSRMPLHDNVRQLHEPRFNSRLINCDNQSTAPVP